MSYGASTTKAQRKVKTNLSESLARAHPDATDRRPCFGSWLQFPGAQLARIVCGTGVDWVLVDTEHGAIGDTEMHASVPAIAATGVAPVVRLPAGEPWMIKRALDAGAHGLMIPMVETREQAEALVRASKFPPRGVRGCGSPFAPDVFGQTMGEYIDTANESTILIVQIESPLGLKNAQEIAAVDGVDMLFVGPNDLAMAMGNGSKSHTECPDVQNAIAEVLRVAHAAGKHAGMFAVNAEQAAARYKQGFQFVNVGADIVAIQAWMGGEMARVAQLV
ncbi:hypothetical protein PLICRDRAFT_146366 [Plicaturopsis crispa FD-325 SS-3]|uniref:HpcH/HpaI aldolase/citrate lyase domain-containing protein n=1 Tax=Plicaturopsis crispa FD-325 SS-3 TaxID=944288 RepID=A0A0C9SY68_PLICR|nr:hypothetical protein PLICRDRAFT_146366 [Plicaturopsis crispa FD-325 SS-3]